MQRTKNAVRNIIFGFINKAIVLLGPFVIRTILIRKLGSEYLGLSSLFTSILQVLNLTELGFSSAVVYSMYKPIAEKDTDTICALMNLYKKIYRIIGCVILLIGLVITPFIKNFISGSYPEDINLYVLYILYLVNTSTTYFLFAYKSALLTAYQRSDIVSNVNTIAYLIQYVFQGIVICVWKNYYAYVVVAIISAILNNILCAYRASKIYPECVPKGKVDKEITSGIKKQVGGLMIQKVCATTRNSFDSIFISMFLGLNMVAIYSNYYSIMNAIIGIMSIFTTAIVAGIGNSIVTESVEKNYKDMNKFNFIYMWISGWCTVCLACLFQPFMKIWMGEEYMFPYGVVVLLSLYFYVLKTGDILSTYTQASGIWWEGRHKALIETVANLLLNYFLGKYFGVYGIILATIISLSTIGFIYGTSIVFKNYFVGISKKEYYLKHFLYFSITVIAWIITYILCNCINLEGILQLLVCGIICLIIPNLIFVIAYFKTPMFKDMIKFMNSILNKKGEKNGI